MSLKKLNVVTQRRAASRQVAFDPDQLNALFGLTGETAVKRQRRAGCDGELESELLAQEANNLLK